MKRIFFVFIFLFTIEQYLLADSPDISDFEVEYKTQVYDPLEGYNRFMNNVNWKLYDYIFSPILDVYNMVTPVGFRMGIYNFFNNLFSPLNILTNLLSMRFKEAYDETGRFALNSTVGILGIFDVATQNGLYSNKSDFGVVFGVYGVKSGFYLVLPILGPSNLRDFAAMPLNSLAYPLNYIEPISVSGGVQVLKEVNFLVINKDRFDDFRDNTNDNYLFIRDTYEQYREGLIRK